jgi:hypothetical protein
MGVLLSRNNTMFYGESVLDFFARFAMIMYVPKKELT